MDKAKHLNRANQMIKALFLAPAFCAIVAEDVTNPHHDAYMKAHRKAMHMACDLSLGLVPHCEFNTQVVEVNKILMIAYAEYIRDMGIEMDKAGIENFIEVMETPADSIPELREQYERAASTLSENGALVATRLKGMFGSYCERMIATVGGVEAFAKIQREASETIGIGEDSDDKRTLVIANVFAALVSAYASRVYSYRNMAETIEASSASAYLLKTFLVTPSANVGCSFQMSLEQILSKAKSEILDSVEAGLERLEGDLKKKSDEVSSEPEQEPAFELPSNVYQFPGSKAIH